MFHLNCTNRCFLDPRIRSLYLNTVYLHLEQVFSKEAAMFFTVAQTGQTKHLLGFYDNWRLQVLLHAWKGRMWGVISWTYNLTTRCHKILHTEPLISTIKTAAHLKNFSKCRATLYHWFVDPYLNPLKEHNQDNLDFVFIQTISVVIYV